MYVRNKDDFRKRGKIMSKELETLEVSKQLKDFVLEFVKNGLDRRFIHGSFYIIETAIKENGKLKECYENELKNTAYYNNLALKYKRAVEIIKEHRLDIDRFLQFVKQDISYQHYVYCIEQSDNAFAKRFLLNKEEYELLKEILK